MELTVYKINGSDSGEKVKLNPEIFEIEPNDHVIYLAVKAYLANQRQGTHSVKNRAAVAGGGRKPFRQKGTGRARQGTIRAAHMVGGGRAFGPHPRDYRQDLPKKVRRLARKSALTYKARDGQITVVEDFTFEEPKTKKVVELLQKLNVTERKVLFLTNDYDANLYRSARNIPYKWVQRASDVSTYDIVNAERIIFLKSALETLNEVLAK